jgi:S1-C subfamily serine protease
MSLLKGHLAYTLTGCQYDHGENCDCRGNNALRKPTMSRISIPIIVLISAVIGAAVGALLAYNVLGSSLNSEIETRLASYVAQSGNSPAMEVNQATFTPAGENIRTGEDPGINGSFLLDPEEAAVTNVFQTMSPSVVHVSTIQYYRNFFFQEVPQEGLGSGFIISEDGYILTNNHVVAGAQEITVRLWNGDEYLADLVGTDQMTDMAVLHINDLDIPPEWVAPMGDSDSLQVGQRAIAIGNPFGLDSTVTVGVISALNRPLTTSETSFENMIQTDASINPGNSGGPLIDSSGKVIGINTVIFSQSGGSHGIGFAIPINAAKGVADDLIQYGRIRRPSLGFNGFTVYPNLADALGLEVGYGVLVQEVTSGSGADDAGLLGGTNLVTIRDRFRQYRFYDDGDIIIELDGEKVTEITLLSERIRRMELGEEVMITVMRNGDRVDLTLTLTE